MILETSQANVFQTASEAEPPLLLPAGRNPTAINKDATFSSPPPAQTSLPESAPARRGASRRRADFIPLGPPLAQNGSPRSAPRSAPSRAVGPLVGTGRSGSLTPCMQTRPPRHIDPDRLGSPPARPRTLMPGHPDAAMAFWAEGTEPALPKSARTDAGPPAQHGGHNAGAYIHVSPLDTVAAGGGAGGTGSGLPAPQPCLLRRKTPSNCPAPTAPP